MSTKLRFFFRFALLLLSGVFFARHVTAAPRGDTPKPDAPKDVQLAFEELTLPNGLRVLLHEDHRTPQVAVNVWYRVGFADDPPGKRGLAHLFEHMMLRGSKHVGRDRSFGLLTAAGASEQNATTSFDRTNYFETVPSNQLALALWIESDRMGFFLDTLDGAILDKEKEVVRNEYRSGTQDKPYAFLQRFARNAVYPMGHPYHWTIEGEMQDTDAITIDDVRTFFRAHYGPNNATLVIAGDIDRVAAKALVEKYFASLPRSPAVRDPRVVVTAPILDSEIRIDVETGAEAPRLMIGWPGPPDFTEGDVSMKLLADLLARSKAGRLYDALVRGAAVADAVRISQDVFGVRHARILWLVVDLKKGLDPARALTIVDGVLDELRAKGPTVDEVERAKARVNTSRLWSLESVTTRADLLNELDEIGGSPTVFTRVQGWTGAATQASLRDALVRWMPKDRRAVVFSRYVQGASVSGREVQR